MDEAAAFLIDGFNLACTLAKESLKAAYCMSNILYRYKSWPRHQTLKVYGFYINMMIIPCVKLDLIRLHVLPLQPMHNTGIQYLPYATPEYFLPA